MRSHRQALPQSPGTNEQHSVQTLHRACAILTFSLLVYAVVIAWYSWIDEKADVVASLATIAELEARAIDRYFGRLEIDLRSLGEDLTEKADTIDPDQAYALVRRFRENHPELFNVTLLLPDGEVLLTAKSPPGTVRASLAGEPSFIAFIEEFGQGKVVGIGQPLVAVVSKVVIVPVRYAIKDRQGRLSYIVSANLPQEYLRSYWMAAPITATAAIGLMRDNGFLLSRYPVPADLSLEQIYGRPRTGALINALRQQGFPESGVVEGPSSLDGPDFLNAFRRLPNYPATLFVALPFSDVRASWWRRVGGTFVALLLLFLSGLATYRYALRRLRAANATQGRLEAAQRESESRFRMMADSAPVLIWIAGADRLCNYFNQVWLRFTGRTAEQEMGSGWAEGVHPDDRQRCRDVYVTAFDARREFAIEYRLRRFDGEYRWLVDNGVPRHDHQGAFLGYIGSCVDITERRQVMDLLDEKMALLNTVLENSSVGITFVRDRRQVWSNPRMGELFGYTEAEMDGQNTRMFYPSQESYEELGRMGYAALSRGAPFATEREMRRKDGSLVWMRLSGRAVDPDDLAAGTIWVFEDFREQKRVQSELLAAKDAAEAANVAKSRFLTTMSHEIRTPMNGIFGMAQMLLMPGIGEAERQDYARTILNSGQTLLTLLNDILDLSRVEAGKFALESVAFDAEDVVREARILFVDAATRKGLRIESDCAGPTGRRYFGDPNRLRQMLSNLVGNAIKFTRQGHVRIEAREVESDGRSAILEFAVVDTGIGVPPEKVKLLFQPFSQADNSTTRQFGGSGLGLSIVRALAKLMDGEADVASIAGQGSRFWFRIRAGVVASGGGDERASDEGGPVGAVAQFRGHVLVVEDDRTNRKVIEALLNKLGLTVALAEDGRQGVDALIRDDAADLVLMDVQMPVMDGHAATGRIRTWEAENGRPRRPIIALTADAFGENRQHCLSAGMDDFLAKPIASIDALKAMLRKWLPAASGTPGAEAPASPAAKTVDVHRVAAIWRELEPLLAQSRFGAVSCFRELQDAAAGTDLAAEIADIGRLVDEFRLDQALECLRRMAAAREWGSRGLSA